MTPTDEAAAGQTGVTMGRSTLRIYLGATPGVGKTYAMLNEGWRRCERGTDVVVACAELHGRAHTAEQLRDLEVIPRIPIAYRGRSYAEMDLDAVLARRPEVALVDEMAHTNVPGMRQPSAGRTSTSSSTRGPRSSQRSTSSTSSPSTTSSPPSPASPSARPSLTGWSGPPIRSS